MNSQGEPEVFVIVMDEKAGVSRVKSYRDQGYQHEQPPHSGKHADKDEVNHLCESLHGRDYKKDRYKSNVTLQDLGGSPSKSSTLPTASPPAKKAKISHNLLSSEEENEGSDSDADAAPQAAPASQGSKAAGAKAKADAPSFACSCVCVVASLFEFVVLSPPVCVISLF